MSFDPDKSFAPDTDKKTRKDFAGELRAPTGSKTLDFLNKYNNRAAHMIGDMNTAIALAEDPKSAVKKFGSTMAKVMTRGQTYAKTFKDELAALAGMDDFFVTDKEADEYIHRNTKRLIAEAQAMFIKNNKGAYDKLKKLGALKGVVTGKARRVYKKHYSRRRKH